MFIQGEAQVRVEPDRVHALGLIGREISRIVGADDHQTVFLSDFLVEFEGPSAAPARVEEVDNRPVLSRSIRRGQIQRITDGRIILADDICDLTNRRRLAFLAGLANPRQRREENQTHRRNDSRARCIPPLYRYYFDGLAPAFRSAAKIHGRDRAYNLFNCSSWGFFHESSAHTG
jgi:hypothetical protein